MKRIWKRMLSAVLAAVMAVSLLPAQALAAYGGVSLRDELVALYGEEGGAQYDFLAENGLLDGDELITDAPVTYDGKDYTLDEMAALLGGADAPADGESVSIAGTELTVADLRQLIEVKSALDEARAEYESWTDEQKTNYADFLDNLNRGNVLIENRAQNGGGLPPSGVDHSVRVGVSYNGSSLSSSSVITVDNSDDGLFFPLYVTKDPGSMVTVYWETSEGSAKAGTNFEATKDHVTFGAEGGAGFTIPILKSSERWNGVRTFLIRLSTDGSILFENGLDHMTIQVNIANDSHYMTPDEYNKVYNYDFYFTEGGNGKYYGEYHWIGDICYGFFGDQWLDKDGDYRSEGWRRHMTDTVNLIFTYYTVPEYAQNAIREGTLTQLWAHWDTSRSDANKDENFTATVSLGSAPGVSVVSQDFSGELWFNWDARYNLVDKYKIDNPTAFLNSLSDGKYCLVKEISQPNQWCGIIVRTKGLALTDEVNPSLTRVTAPAGDYVAGDVIPVTLTFSEPVKLDGLTITINGKDAANPGKTLSVTGGGVGTSATFLYPVELGDSADTFAVTNISTFTDITGHSTTINAYNNSDGTPKYLMGGVEIKALSMRSAVDRISLAKTAFGPSDESATLTVTLNDALASTFRGMGLTGKGESALLAAYVDRKPGDADAEPIYLAGNDGVPNVFTATIPIEKNRTGSTETHYVELYFLKDVPGDVSAGDLYFGQVASFTVSPVIFLENGDISISYSEGFPADGSTVYADEAPENMKLTAKVSKPTATYGAVGPDNFRWASSNPSVAAISNEADTFGRITLGSGTGEVYFTLTALNGDQDDTDHHPDIKSRSFTMQVGNNPYLKFQSGTLSIRRGQPITVQWLTNLMYKWADASGKTGEDYQNYETEFTVTAKNAGTGEIVHTATVKSSVGNPVSTYTFPLELSSTNNVSYTVTVAAKDPTGKEYADSQTVAIKANPAVVKLTQPAPFLTDSAGSITVNWSIQELNREAAETTFKATLRNSQTGKVQTVEGKDNAGDYNADKSAVEGSAVFEIPKVDGKNYREIYTLEVTAANDVNLSPSFDAYTFYVYNSGILKLWVDGQAAGSSLTMSNEDDIKKLIGDGGKAGQQAVLDLNRDIALTNGLSINQDVPWGNISDQIEWKSSDSSKASVNYRQGTLYENIENFSRESYDPSANFLLSGLQNGATTVTATHAQLKEALQASLDVTMNTLADKLYLFQLYPAIETVMTYQYKDEAGELHDGKTVSTATGGAAIYAPGGIVGDVYCKATAADKTVYVGTIYHNKLLSGERDSTKLELYPLNSFTLRQVAVADFYLKNPDGTPFTGDVTIHTGVYKNGEYCAEARFGDTADNVDASGVDGLTVNVKSGGRLTVHMDPTQFWLKDEDEELLASDDLEYLFEMDFGSACLPRLVSVDANMNSAEVVRSASGVLELEANAAGNASQPVLARQVADYGAPGDAEVFQQTGKVGPSDRYPEVKLTSYVLWWNTDKDAVLKGRNAARLSNAAGAELSGQTSENMVYPFSTMAVTRNTLTLNADTLDGWLASEQSGKMVLTSYDSSGALAYRQTLPFQAVNMLGAADVTTVNGEAVLDTVAGMMDHSNSDLDGFVGILGKAANDKMGDALKKLGTMDDGLGSQDGLLFLQVMPTDDPTVFKGLIRVNVGNMNTEALAYDESEGLDVSIGDTVSALKEAKKLVEKVADDGIEGIMKETSEKSPWPDPVFRLEGYMESVIYFDENAGMDGVGMWKIQVLNGGFTAYGGAQWDMNLTMGMIILPLYVPPTIIVLVPIPLKAVLNTDLAVGVNFNAAVDRAGDDTYYLSQLITLAYIYASYGINLDVSIAAFKLGFFGSVRLTSYLTWLNSQNDGSLHGNIPGSKIRLEGQIGAEFEAKVLGISYKTTLASLKYDNEWIDDQYKDIMKQWDAVKSGNSSVLNGARNYALTSAVQNPLDSESMIVTAQAAPALESRDYLTDYGDRAWHSAPLFSLFSFAQQMGPTETWTNAYPYASPLLSDDGQIMVYLTDQDKADDATSVRAAWAVKDGGDNDYYDNKNLIATGDDNFGYGDYNLDIAGTSTGAVVTWVRTTEAPKTEPGASLSAADQSQMLNSAEIMASVYDGTTWTTTRLTNNAIPDLAPKAAADGEGHYSVTWRTGDGRIVCATYKDGAWSAAGATAQAEDAAGYPGTVELYNGTLGAVNGIDAVMLPGGTTAVIYAVDTSGGTASTMTYGGEEYTYNAPNYDYQEIYATICQPDGEIRSIRLTQNDVSDENPQITAVKIDGTEHFVAAWSTLGKGGEAANLSLAAFDADGNLRSDVAGNLSAATQNGDASLSSTFRFLRGAETIEDLALLWVQSDAQNTKDPENPTVARSVVKAARFFQSGSGGYGVTGALDVAEMPDYVALDSFDAYHAGGDKVNLVLLGTSYVAENGTHDITVENGGGETVTVTLANGKSTLYTAGETFANKAEVAEVSYEASQVVPGMALPMLFSVTNRGYENITSAAITVGGAEPVVYDNFTLEPGQTKTFSLSCAMPDPVADTTYTLHTTFENGDENDVTGDLAFNRPGVGISQMKTVGEADGKREIQFTLYNDTKIPLAGNGGRQVTLGVYSDSACTQQVGDLVRVTGGSDLSLVDDGAYTTRLTVDLRDYLDGESGELPENGVTLYAKAWVEAPEAAGRARNTIGMAAQEENDNANNIRYTTFKPLYVQRAEDVTVDYELRTGDGGSVVTVSLQNNRMSGKTTGNLIVTLLDANGRLLGQQQSYDPQKDNKGLIDLNGEKEVTKTFTFDGLAGASAQVTYSDAVLEDESNTELLYLSLDGVTLSPETRTAETGGAPAAGEQTWYVSSGKDLTQALLTIVTADPEAKVQVDGGDYATARQLSLRGGLNTFAITVTAQDGTVKTYYLEIENTVTPSASYKITVPSGVENGSVKVSPTRASRGTAVTVTVSPDPGYRLEQLAVTASNGRAVEVTHKGGGIYVFTMPASAVSVEARFTPGWSNPFTDVAEGSYYYDAVQWAVSSGVTNGTGDYNFSPDLTVSRAQMVTFLWRAAGSPAAAGGNPFTDVADGSYYYDAVLWAVSSGITKGTGADSFSPDAPVTRAQAVTFQWRAAGAPAASGGGFSDVAADAYYSEAVAWAVAGGVTNGTGGNRFSPDVPVSRAQAVTFLFRAQPESPAR